MYHHVDKEIDVVSLRFAQEFPPSLGKLYYHDAMNDSWIACVPKVELHLHIEGAIPYEALWALLCKYGGDREVPTLESLADRFVYRDFPHFIETWNWKNTYLREYEDFEYIAEAVAHDLSAQGIRYVEAFFSPPDFEIHGLEAQRLTEAVRKGLDRVPSIRIALIADIVRGRPVEKAQMLLDAMLEVRGLGVIGLGIGGKEHAHPPGQYAPVFRRARENGFHLTAHAGEAAGPPSIWSAIRDLGAERIGHGTRAIEDDDLVMHLVDTGITLEMCPGSNVRTGVVPTLAAHPIRQFFDRGVRVTVNTDDPKMFGTSLLEEYQSLQTTHGFTRDEIQQLILEAVAASWLNDDEKQDLAREVQEFREPQ